MNVFLPFLFLMLGNDPPFRIKTFAEDGAWLWFNDQNIIVDKNIIYMGCENSGGYSTVNVYEEHGKETLRKEYVLGTLPAKDDHNYPALLILPDGKMLATYSRNPSAEMYYRKAGISHDQRDQVTLDWNKEDSVSLRHRMSYNNSFLLSDKNNTVYNWYSIFTGSPSIITSSDQGKTWSADITYMKAGRNHSSPYLKYCSDGRKRVDILYTDGHPRNEKKNNIYHLYFQNGQFRGSGGNLIRSMDSAITNPIDPFQGTMVYNGSTEGPGWVWDIEYDRRKNPVAAYISSADSSMGNDLRYRYARWDDKKKRWHEKQIAFAGNHLYVPENHFAGGITIDPYNTNVVYISSNADPYTGIQTANHHYQIYRGEISPKGQNWLWRQLTNDKDRDNLRPIVPRNHGARICVLWFAGEYRSSVNFKTKVMGIFEQK